MELSFSLGASASEEDHHRGLQPTQFVPSDDEEEGEDSASRSRNSRSSTGSSSSSASSEDSSSSSSSSEEDEGALPSTVEEWVLTDPKVPHQFSRKHDYTKQYSLRSYNQNKRLKKQLRRWSRWWTKTRNAQRQASSWNPNTLAKRKERVLCYLGFVEVYRCLPEKRDFDLGLVLNHRLVDAFLEYQTTVRQASDGTITEMLSALISVCKWLYRKEPDTGVKFANVAIIRRYKDWRNQHQARAQRERKQIDAEDLREAGKWVEWPALVAAIQEMREEWNSTDTTEPSVDLARQLHDLLLMGLYVMIPSRAAEVRLLQFIPYEELPRFRGTLKQHVDREQINLLTCKPSAEEETDPKWTMLISQYKNYRHRGVDVTLMDADPDQFGWWIDLLQTYFATFRPMLEPENRFVFLTTRGEPFKEGYFSSYVSGLVHQLTGQRVSVNLLRSSFVTHFYASEQAQDPEVRQSVAQVMRHSVREAQSTYDRRSAPQRKRKGLNAIGRLLAGKKKSKKGE